MEETTQEIMDPVPEPTFIRLETSARDALRRFSNHSHPSVAHSNSLYTNATITPSKPPSRVASLRPPLTLHTTNPDPDGSVEEHMNIAVDTGIPISYEDSIKMTKSGQPKSFIGGFFRGFKRLPRVLRRRPRKGTDATEATQGTLPVYMTNPPTPVVPPSGNAQYAHSRASYHAGEHDVPLSEDDRRRNPSFYITPPTDDLGGDEQEILSHLDPALGLPPNRHHTYDQTTYTADATVIPVPSSPNLTRSPATDLHTVLSPPAPLPESLHNDDEVPVSVHANPLPSQDYRRMSKSYTGTRRSATTMSSSEPSFSSELNGLQRFFTTLWTMPWIASGRLTEDYRPGADTGAWVWKRVGANGRRNRRSGGQRSSRNRFSLRPVQKPLASWYTDLSGKSAGAVEKDAERPSWVASPLPREEAIDLLSSGTGTRSSVLSRESARSDPSSVPISPRSHYRTVERTHHRRQEPPLHSTPRLRPGTRTSPKTRHKHVPNQHGPNQPTHSRHERSRRSERRDYGGHGQRDPTSQHSPPGSTTPVPFSPIYSHGYLPSSQMQYQNTPPLVSVPIVVPQSSPMYVTSMSPPSSVQEGTPNPASSDGQEPTQTPSPNHATQSVLPMVYMPVLGGQLFRPGNSHPLGSVSEGSEGTPPGLAGRGAYGPPRHGYGYVPGQYPNQN